ncbi:MAG: UDP-3-O-(3-hydroxymyristoyl)glucosamine N-acyltransferase [Deltaproteobacteria bacterium]|nr:UDP-3-O-(3-hydroxymyristoyl)glucosamine N-acyltransferase [Deltaproteobacteria bacterium]
MIEKTVGELAELVGGRVLRGSSAARVRRVAPLDLAEADSVSFVSKPSYLPHLATTRAGAVMVSPAVADKAVVGAGTTLIVVLQPYVAFARAAQIFAAKAPRPEGVHPSAVIEGEVGPSVSAGPFVYVGVGAIVEEGCVLYAGVHVESGARIGAGSILYDHVVVRHGCVVGERNILHPGVVIGTDGFGFAQERGEDGVEHVKIPQTGVVVLEDDVEIGANSCVDRAALGVTRVGRGTKIDNLVQVGHNVEIGPGCILVAQSGVAGSSKLGRGVILGAQSGVSGHLSVGDGAVLLGQAGVIKDVEAGDKVAGMPARSSTHYFKDQLRVQKLAELTNRVRELEKKLDGSV